MTTTTTSKTSLNSFDDKRFYVYILCIKRCRQKSSNLEY